VRETDSERQFREVVRAFQLERAFAPFSRCRVCNAALREVAKEALRGRVPEAVWMQLDEFTECRECGRIFWRGTHYERLRRILRTAGASGLCLACYAAQFDLLAEQFRLSS